MTKTKNVEHNYGNRIDIDIQNTDKIMKGVNVNLKFKAHHTFDLLLLQI